MTKHVSLKQKIEKILEKMQISKNYLLRSKYISYMCLKVKNLRFFS